MFSFPISSKKIAVIFLLIVLAILLGVVSLVIASKMQAKDVLKYMSSQDLLAVTEIHNNEESRGQWKQFSEKYAAETMTESLLGTAKTDGNALFGSLPEKSYLIVYKDGAIFAFTEENNLTQKKLIDALKNNFTVVTQDNFVFVANISAESIKTHLYSKEKGGSKIADAMSKSLFDSTAAISFTAAEGVTLDTLGDFIVSKLYEPVYKVFARDILSSMTQPSGNFFVTSEGYLTMTGKVKVPKEELKYFVQRDKLDISVLSSFARNIPTIIAFVAEPNLLETFMQYFKEEKSEAIALSWQYLGEAFLERLKVIEQPKEFMGQLEKASVAIGITSTGSILGSITGIDVQRADKITELLKTGVEKNLAYEEISTTLPDKTKAVLLERHPENVSLTDKSASGSFLKEIKFNDTALVNIFGKDSAYLITDGKTELVHDISQYALLQKYFKEPSQWFAKIRYTLPVQTLPYFSDAMKEEKKNGSVFVSISTYTDGISYRVLFVPAE